MEKIYVTMTDKFLSGWGCASNRNSKWVIECETWSQAEEVARNAKDKVSGMGHINITSNKPYYSPSRYVVTYKTYANCGRLFKD